MKVQFGKELIRIRIILHPDEKESTRTKAHPGDGPTPMRALQGTLTNVEKLKSSNFKSWIEMLADFYIPGFSNAYDFYLPTL